MIPSADSFILHTVDDDISTENALHLLVQPEKDPHLRSRSLLLDKSTPPALR